jgi:hypothetical protein
VDVQAFLIAVTAKMRFSPKPTPIALVADHLWEIGHARFDVPGHRTPVLFGRRLCDRSNWQSIRRILEARSGQRSSVLLTSTRHELLPEIPNGYVLISLPDVIETGLALDPSLIAARLHRLPEVQSNEPLLVFADGREVQFFGESFRFPKGVQQRRIICYMHKRYQSGELTVSEDRLIVDLDLPRKARVRDYLKTHAAWGRLLTVRNGVCSFCWPAKK